MLLSWKSVRFVRLACQGCEGILEMTKKRPDDRLVRDWIKLGVALVRLLAAIVNAVFNYSFRRAR